MHDGSGQEFVQPLVWNGTRSALSTWNIPAAAKLGSYRIVLERTGADERQRRSWSSGDFRVEEFRLPLVDARLSGPEGPARRTGHVAHRRADELLLRRGDGQCALEGLGVLRERPAGVAGYDEFSFQPPRDLARGEEADDEAGSRGEGRLVADKLPLTTDRNGAASFTLKELPKITRPSELVAEVTYNDPNGEVQTASTTLRLWPSAVVPGIRTGSWASARGKVNVTALALDMAGKPIKGQALEVRARLAQVISTRKRMVGGFYAYDNRTEVKDLGVLCSGASDDRGQLACEATLDTAGQVELVVQAKDAAGHVAQAAGSVWVTKQGELWFAQDNDDRIDVLPEKKRYEPGETARLQVRMPFREATALVAIEREGVIDTRVITLRGDDRRSRSRSTRPGRPTCTSACWRCAGASARSSGTRSSPGDGKQPLDWWRAFRDEGPDYRAPTAMVDLAKPAFKLGVAALQVGLAEHELQVMVTADQPQYAVRQKAKARIKVAYQGKPLAGTEVAFAAVDEGLLALRGNESWDLLQQ